MEHFDVLIITPGNSVVADYVVSLSETLSECSKRGLTWKYLNGQSSLVHHARELAISGANSQRELNVLHKGPMGDLVTYNKIVWIDSDISWRVQDFFKLYESDKEVITGGYMSLDGSVQIHQWGKNGGVSIAEVRQMKEVTKIQSMGFGFCSMKSGVFERIPRPWFDPVFVPVGNDENGNPITGMVGEDISWCVKAYEVGIDIFFDPSVLVTHHKTVPLSFY